MAATRNYRLTLFTPRSVDATETTALTPRAGAAHADAFRVATVQGLGGYQPYLDTFRGRRSSLDPLEKRTDIGQLTVRLLDTRTGSNNLQRWVTAFLGDADGNTRLMGRRCLIEEQQPNGSWATFFTGRVANARLDGRLWYELEVRENADDLDRDVFVGPPATSVTYAGLPPAAPNVLLLPYGDFPVGKPLRGKTATPAAGGTHAFRIDVDRTHGDLSRTLITQALDDLAGYGLGSDAATSYGRGLVRLTTDGGTTWRDYDLDFPHVTGLDTSLTAVQARPLTTPGAAASPAGGTVCDFYVLDLHAKPSARTPLYVADVHPVAFLRDLCAGKFGPLDATGAPRWSVPIDTTSFDQLQGDASLGTMRFRITEAKKLAEVIEEWIAQPLGIAYYLNASGAITLVDLRRSSALAPVTTLTDDDLANPAGALGWEQSRGDAVTSVTASYYAERFVEAAELPKPFTARTPGDAWPDVAGGRVEQDGESTVVRVQGFGPNVDDVKGSDYKIDAVGYRYRSPNASGGDAEKIGGDKRADVLQRRLTAAAAELKTPYALGPCRVTLKCRRASANVALASVGAYVVLNVSALPDPATNQRGGQRLALVTGRAEDGPYVDLTCVDAGASAVAVGPSLGTVSLGADPKRDVGVTVTLNPAGQPARVELAVTSTSVGAAPSSGWQFATTVSASGAVTLTAPAGAPRVWVRARSEPGAGKGFAIPSGFVLPTGAGYVDLNVIPAPSGLSAAADAEGIALAWTTGDATLETDVFVSANAAPGEWSETYRVATLQPGSTRYRWQQGAAGTSYVFAVRHRDAFGNVSTVATTTGAATGQDLDAPTDATPWAGPHDPVTGAARPDGVYGLAVAAAVIPGELEVVEAVETAAGSGVFGAFSPVGRVPAVQGDWSVWSGTAPNDGRVRQLAARSVRGSSVSDYTEAVEVLPWTPLELPLFARTIGSTELRDLAFTESDTARTYTWARGAKVTYIWAFDRLAPLPLSADPAPNATDLPDRILRAGEDSITIAKPPGGFARILYLVPWHARGAGFRRGPAILVTLDPVSSALAGSVKAVVAGDRATLAVRVDGSDSDWPVTADLLEGDPAGAPLASRTFSGSGTWTAADTPALGNRSLPLNELQHWYLRLTNRAGAISWGAPATADRDSLARLVVSRRDYLAAAIVSIDYDDDTDAVKLTVPGGRLKTWTGLAGSGTLVYIVGTTALNDGTTEPALAVGATRTGYLVEGQGGGTWRPFWQGDLHGPPTSAPTARPRAVATASGAAEDVYVLVQSAAPEAVTLRLRDGEGVSAPVYTLCQSASNAATRYVTSGTELGPTDWVTDGTNAPVQKLAAIALTLDQIRRVYVQAVGQESGVQGAWAPVPLSLLAAPWLDSIAATWDEASGKLRVRVKGGPRCQSVLVEVDDNVDFSSPATASSALAVGGEYTAQFALSGAARGRTWYARATPYNATGLGGLAGGSAVDECAIPARVTYKIEATANNTLRVTVDDPGSFVDPVARVMFYVQVSGGPRTLQGPTTAPGGGATSGAYTCTVTLDDKHTTLIEPVIYLLDGSELRPGAETFDADASADIVNAAVMGDLGTATVAVTVDSDTITGAGGVEYSVNGGAWVGVSVSASTRVATFTLPMLTSSVQTVRLRAKNGAGAYGKIVEVPIGTYAAPAGAPSLRVSATPGATSYVVYWTGSGTITYSTNGTSFGTPPTSGFTVTRTTADQVLTFRSVVGTTEISDSLTIPALGKGMDVPDLSLVPGTMTATSCPFTGRAVNPNGGGDVAWTVTCTNCALSTGATSLTTTGAAAFAVTRPAHSNTTPASIRIRSSITGGGAEEFTVPIPNIAQDNPGAITVEIVDASGTVGLSFSGPSTCNSWRWAYSTSGYPSDAAAAAGALWVGRTGKTTFGPVVGALGQAVYVTAIPYTDTAGGAGGGIPHPSAQGMVTWQTKSTAKTMRVPHTYFAPRDNTTPFSTGIGARSPSAKARILLYAPVPVPRGVLLTGLRARFYNVHAAAVTGLELYRIDDYGSAVRVNACDGTPGAGYQTVAAYLSETILGGYTYVFLCTLDTVSAANVNDAQVLWAEVDYIASSLDQSL